MPINPKTPVGNLGIGSQQLVEIAKALSQDAKILVLDEPTAALTESEVETLFGILRELKARGVRMIYISHKLGEIFEMSDRITVLRDGKTVGTNDAKDLTIAKVIALMVGREVGDIIPVLIFLAVALLGVFITNFTTFGSYLYAIGGNPDAGTLKELDAITACVIGGASLMGGHGTIFGACLGALIMASLDNGMSLLNVRDYMQDIIKGLILAAAVGLDMIGKKSS